MTLKNKVALVTGGGSGLGEAAARILAREGAKVAIVGRTKDEAQAVVDQINKSDGKAIFVEGDISRPDHMEKAVAEVVDQWKRLDIVFANAGINGVWAPIEDLTPEEWQQTININLNGTFYTIKYAAPYLKKQGGSVMSPHRSMAHAYLAIPVPPLIHRPKRHRSRWRKCWRSNWRRIVSVSTSFAPARLRVKLMTTPKNETWRR